MKSRAIEAQWRQSLALYGKSPRNFLMTFLLQHKAPISPRKIWAVYLAYPDLRKSGIYNSLSHMKTSAILPLLKSGVVVRDRAVDNPRYRSTGTVTMCEFRDHTQAQMCHAAAEAR